MTNDLHPYWLILASAALAFLPLVVGLTTSFLKIQIVLGMLRSGFGAQQIPSMLVTTALALSMTLFVMSPVLEESFRAATAHKVRIEGMPTVALAAEIAPVLEPWQRFMVKHCGARELEVLSELYRERRAAGAPDVESKNDARGADASEHAGAGAPDSPPEFPVLVTAFVLSELRAAFTMGFVVLLPFLVIDLIVANILTGLGMMMVSPPMISLPLKIILFVLSDGWLLLTRGLIVSYGGG